MRRFSALVALSLLVGPALVPAQDCNGNGIDDGADVRAGRLRFGSPWLFPVEEMPVGLVLEDLDGDGLGDVALARAFGVSIYRNGGDGAFRRSRNLALGSNPVSIAAADLDSNGALDIVTANTIDASQVASNISVNLNRGGGDFAPARNFFVSSIPGHLVCSDLDGDGSRDVAVATRQAAVSVLWNSGTGRLETSTDLPAPAFPREMDAGDVDGDGDDDIVCALESVPSRFLLLRNLGGRRLESETPVPPPDGDPFSAALSDLDGDGDLDLSAMMRLAGEPAGEIALFWNDGRGAFSAQASLGRGRFVAAAAADLDADGLGDVIAVEDGERIEIWSGTGLGEFRHQVQEFRGTELDVLLAVGDLDGAGTRDLALAGQELQVHLLRSDGRGGLEIPVPLRAEVPGTAVDLDADGDTDLLASEAGRVLVLENHRELRFEERRSLWVGAKPGGTAASDVDADGDLDALVSSSRRDVFRLGLAVLLNDGNGELGSPEPYGEHLDIRRMQTADIDRDGDPDIVADGEGSPSVFILENDGAGRFEPPLEVPMAVRHEIASTVVDLDADGHLDLVSVPWLPGVPEEPRDLALISRRGDGRGAFGQAARYALAGHSSSPVPGDWDGDGVLDLALASAPSCAGCPGTVSIFTGLDDGSFYVVTALEGPDGSSAFAGADMNGDGALDVVGADARGGSIFISANGGSGRFESPVVLEIGASPKAIAVHDLDADGDLDLMTVNRSLGAGAEICPSCTEAIGRDLTILQNAGDGRSFAPLHHSGGLDLDDALALDAIDLEGDRLPELAVVDQNGSLFLVVNSTPPAASPDRDRDGRPDECENAFHRGDANGDAALDLADPIHILAHLFLSGEAPRCLETADADDDGEIDLTDAIRLLAHLFLSGPPPEFPGPPGAPCGPDPGLPRDLGCASYTACERVAQAAR